MEYPSNANMPVSTLTQPPVLKSPEKSASVIASPAKVKPASKGIKRAIFAQDFKDIKQGVIDDIIRPKIKDMVFELADNVMNTISCSLQMMIFGDVRRSQNRPMDRVSYNQYAYPSRKIAPAPTPTLSASYNCDNLVYETKGDAEVVLAAMQEHLRHYPYVEVSRMYEFSNLSMPNWTSNNFGWDNLDGVTVKKIDGDYIIDLPRAKPIPK